MKDEVFLRPGDFYFGGEPSRIRTVLGSCVAITMWHPTLRVGGMCHYLLPRPRGRPRGAAPSGLYGEEAMELFLTEVERHRSRPREFVTHVVGGGRMFPGLPFDVARLNVMAARTLLEANGFTVMGEHVGGTGHRQVVLELTTGRVLVSQFAPDWEKR